MISYRTVEVLVSTDRLAPYRSAATSPSDALALYEWNVAISGALYEALGMVEVVLRNAFDRQLQDRHRTRGGVGRWYDAGWLDVHGARDVAVARDRATSRGRSPERHGKVVAELSFGFWRYLVARRYQAVAWPGLQHAFAAHPAGRASRIEVEDRIQRIHTLRNRVAHHEPIIRRRVAGDFDDMCTLLGWIHPEARRWLESMARVSTVLAHRP